MAASDDRQQTPGLLATWLPGGVALTLLLAASAGVLEMMAGPGTKWGWWHYSTGFLLLRWGAQVGAATMAVGVLTLLGALWLRHWRAVGLTAVGLAVGLVMVGIPWMLLQQARNVPPIHDITTDWEEPPAFQAVLPLRQGASNPPEYEGPDVANQQRRFYADLRPALFREAPDAVFAAAQQVAAGLGWAVVAAVPEEGRLEATATTGWFGFRDDVVVRIRPAEGGGSRVDVRSKSRVGRSDLGANAARIRRFLLGLRGAGLTPRQG